MLRISFHSANPAQQLLIGVCTAGQHVCKLWFAIGYGACLIKQYGIHAMRRF
ncbi:hypothetical protein D3C84_1128290 [compost metagenome]